MLAKSVWLDRIAVMKERLKQNVKEGGMLAATAGRLYQAYDYAKKVKHGKSVLGATAAIIAVDQADGMVARKMGVDGPKRRALDSVVDAVIIGAGLASVYKKNKKARPYVGALAVREAFVATGWALDLAKSKQVKQGDISYKLPHLTKAAFCLAANQGSDKAMHVTGAIALAVNAQIAWDYYKGWTDPKRQTMLDTGVVQVPGFYDAKEAIGKFVFPEMRPQLGPGSPAEFSDGITINGIGEEIVDWPETIDGTAIELPDEPI